jgi:hypothetical protein
MSWSLHVNTDMRLGILFYRNLPTGRPESISMRAILEKFDGLQTGNTHLAETYCCLMQKSTHFAERQELTKNLYYQLNM